MPIENASLTNHDSAILLAPDVSGKTPEPPKRNNSNDNSVGGPSNGRISLETVEPSDNKHRPFIDRIPGGKYLKPLMHPVAAPIVLTLIVAIPLGIFTGGIGLVAVPGLLLTTTGLISFPQITPSNQQTNVNSDRQANLLDDSENKPSRKKTNSAFVENPIDDDGYLRHTPIGQFNEWNDPQ